MKQYLLSKTFLVVAALGASQGYAFRATCSSVEGPLEVFVSDVTPLRAYLQFRGQEKLNATFTTEQNYAFLVWETTNPKVKVTIEIASCRSAPSALPHTANPKICGAIFERNGISSPDASCVYY